MTVISILHLPSAEPTTDLLITGTDNDGTECTFTIAVPSDYANAAKRAFDHLVAFGILTLPDLAYIGAVGRTRSLDKHQP